MNRFRNSAFYRPTSVKAAHYCAVTDTEVSCPDRDRMGCSTVRPKAVTSLVDCLFMLCCPTAVFWAIITIVIDSLNLKARLVRRSHICEKIIKHVPSFADLDSTAAIVLVAIVVFVI